MSDDHMVPVSLRRDPQFEEQLERLWAMTAPERVAAMRAGQLSLRLLCAWSARYPHEVPTISTGSGLQGGEFEWLATFEPSLAEPCDTAAHRGSGAGGGRASSASPPATT